MTFILLNAVVKKSNIAIMSPFIWICLCKISRDIVAKIYDRITTLILQKIRINQMKNLNFSDIFPKWAKIALFVLSSIAIALLSVAFALQKWADSHEAIQKIT